MGKKESFYYQQIPQSEYRNAKDKTAEDRTTLEADLQDLGLTDEELKEGVRDKVKECANRFASMLLPEERHEAFMKSKCLKSINKSTLFFYLYCIPCFKYFITILKIYQ